MRPIGLVSSVGRRGRPCSRCPATALGISLPSPPSTTTASQQQHPSQGGQTRRASTSTSSGSSSSHSSGSKTRDHRVPLLVGGSLVGAGSLQYYLHRRALATTTGGGATAAAAAAAHTAATKTGLQRALSTHASAAATTAAPSTTTTSSSSADNNTPSPSHSSASPPPRVQAPSLWSSWGRRGLATSATAAGTKEGEGEGKNPLQGLEITLYQYKICPFCCKVKAVLDLYKVPYATLDVNPLTKSEIKFSPDYRKVPIARLGPDEVVTDSSAIVDRIAALLRQGNAAPAKQLDAFFSPDAARWAAWADMELAVLLFPNITRSFAESFQAFSYVQDVPHFGLLDKLSNQWVGATAMWAAQGKIKKKYNITDERAALHAALGDWAAQVSGPGKAPFLGGAVPNYGDVAVYACLRAIEGLDAWKEIMAGNEAVAAWYARVENAIGASACVKAE